MTVRDNYLRNLKKELRALPTGTLRSISAQWERATGYDSIETVEFNYDRNDTLAKGIQCVWPGCPYSLTDPIEMWLHVHFAKRHDRVLATYKHHDIEKRLDVLEDLLATERAQHAIRSST